MSFCRDDGACGICDEKSPACPDCRECIEDCDCEAGEFEWPPRSANRFVKAQVVARLYHERRWASPVSGDATTIRSKFQ